MIDLRYREQVTLLLQALPHISPDGVFALKGGTAINLFIRDMPRLSVDIDLTYLPIEERQSSLKGIHEGLREISNAIAKAIPTIRIIPKRSDSALVGLLIGNERAQIKIEPNLVLRGSVLPPDNRDLCNRAQNDFGAFVTTKILSILDLYDGKICAALDRQHPRDLFDIKLLLDREGITEPIRKAFIVYLASHNRPMNELLQPSLLDLSDSFVKEFRGMTNKPIDREALEESRKQLLQALRSGLTAAEKEFLLSIKQGTPKWDILNLYGIDRLPGIQWKLANIKKMDRKKHREAVAKLTECLDGYS